MHSNSQNKSLAIRYAQQALQTAEKRAFDKSILADAHLTLYLLSKDIDDFNAALAHHEQYHNYYDSIYTENAQAKVKEEQVKQNIAGYLAEKQLAQSNATLLAERNKIYIIAASLLSLLLVLTVFFILKLRQIGARLKMQNAELVNLNQTKDRFFSIIAHDIRSPIVALDSVEAQMKYYTEKNDTQKIMNIAGLVSKTAGQLNALLDNLLQWALTQTGRIPYKPSPLNAHEIIGEILQLFEPNARSKGIELKNEVTRDLSTFADIDAFHTIFRNLLSNAIKFTPRDGSVIVSSQKINDRALINVRDSGKGISEVRKINLFALEKNNEKGTAGEKGTGLGLVLCHDLILQNKGSLTVQSEVGMGSTFIVDLPCTP
jgi:signal transduction histidine kinase